MEIIIRVTHFFHTVGNGWCIICAT